MNTKAAAPFDLETAISKLAPAGGAIHITLIEAPNGLVPNTYVRPKAAGLVTITADPGIKFSGFVFQSGSGNIVLDGLEILVDPSQRVAVVVQSAHDVHIRNCKLHGAAVSDGLGVRFLNATNCSIEKSDLGLLGAGVSVGNCSVISIDANSIHDLQVDGVQVGGVQHIAITNNHFTNFFPQPGDHSDAIQFLTANQTVRPADILIQGNIFERGNVPVPSADHPGTQGIFMGDESAIGYGNVSILKNGIFGAVYHGITLERGDGVDIGGNVVAAYNDGNDMTSWIETQACTGGTIHDNITTNLNPAAEPGHPETMDKLTPINNTIIKPITPADVPAYIAKLKGTAPVPVVTPPADPNLAIISDLQAKLADAVAATTAAKAATALLSNQLNGAKSDLAAALARLADAGAQISADEARIAADEAILAKVRSALG